MLITKVRHTVLILSMISELISCMSINSFNELDLLSAVCVHNSFDCRNRSVPKLPTGYKSCCQQCVCSEDCAAGNCCPNSAMNPFMKAPCRSQSSLFGKHPYLWRTIKKLQFYTVDTCPENSDAALKSACDDPRDIRDFNLVSDAKNNNIFKNEKCALCNGITSIKRWYQGFVLGEETNETEVLHIVREKKPSQLSQHVQIYSYPPKDFPAHLYFCNVDTIKKCNVSGAWDEYDETIVSLCENPLLTSSYPSTTKLYKNVYCMRCNTKKSNKRPAACRDTDLLSGYIYKKLRMYRMTMLLESDWPTGENDLVDVGHTYCATDEVPDPWTGECIVLNCPVGTSAFFGQCQKNKYTTDGLALEIILELTIENSSRSEWLNLTMIESFDKSIAATEYGCRLYTWRLWAHNNVTRNCYYLAITIGTRNGCNETDIITIYYQLLYGEKIPLSRQYSTLKLTLIEREHFVQLQNLTILFKEFRTKCSHYITLKNNFYCPSITFNITKLDQYILPQKLHKVLIGMSKLLQWPRGNNEIYSVCWSDFKKVKKSYLGTTVSSEITVYFSLACTCILSCMAVTALTINFCNPEIPRALKLVLSFLCVIVVFERIFNEVMLKVKVSHKITILILRNVTGSFCSLLISFANAGILLAIHKMDDSQPDLESFGSRVRIGMLLSLCVAFILASCEGLYLLACYNLVINDNPNKNILAHCAACFLPLSAAICIGLTLICKQFVTSINDADQHVIEITSFSRRLFLASIFSVIVEVVRAASDFMQSPHFSLVSSALSVPYSIIILVCFTFRVQQVSMRYIRSIRDFLAPCKYRK